MSASLAISNRDERTPSPEWVGSLAQLSRAVGPVKLADHSHRLPTADDVRAAARHRLRKWTSVQIGLGLDSVAEMLPTLDASALGSPDRLDPWTACCALAVLHADKVGALDVFWSAGSEVLAAYRQAQRARYERTRDSLTRLMKPYAMEGISPAAMWQDFCGRAEDGFDDLLVDFDEGRGVLTYVANPNRSDSLVDIQFPAFRKRAQRISRRLLRQQPANVAPRPLSSDHGL